MIKFGAEPFNLGKCQEATQTKSFCAYYNIMMAIRFTKLRIAARKQSRCNTCAILVFATIAMTFAVPGTVYAKQIAWYGINRDFGKHVLYLVRNSVQRKDDTESAWLLYDFRDPHYTLIGLKRYRSAKAPQYSQQDVERAARLVFELCILMNSAYQLGQEMP